MKNKANKASQPTPKSGAAELYRYAFRGRNLIVDVRHVTEYT